LFDNIAINSILAKMILRRYILLTQIKNYEKPTI